MAGLFKEGWRWAFWGVAALCGLQIALLPSFAHESPVWLLARDAESARARHVLCELRGFAPGGAPLRDEVRLYQGKERGGSHPPPRASSMAGWGSWCWRALAKLARRGRGDDDAIVIRAISLDRLARVALSCRSLGSSRVLPLGSSRVSRRSPRTATW